MSKLSIYFARGMDARIKEDIIFEEQKYRTLLESIDSIISNPFMQSNLNLHENEFNTAERDLVLLKNSDILLADLSIQDYQYVGCFFEIVHAAINNIPIVLIIGERDFDKRIFIQAYADFIAKDFYQAVEYIRRAYTQDGIEKQMEEMKTYYNEIANKYADSSVRTHKRSKEDEKQFMNERTQLRAIITKHARGEVCQMGIGTGDWTSSICEISNRVVGLEQSQEMIRQAHFNLSTYNNLNLFQCDVLKDDISVGPFNCVVIYFLLSILPRSMQDRLFNRIQKLLMPGGILIVADTKKFGDLPSIGLGRRQLQQRRVDDKVFILYKEYFCRETLINLIVKYNYEVLESSKDTVWFSWVISRKLE